jgi:hypothetical protein
MKQVLLLLMFIYSLPMTLKSQSYNNQWLIDSYRQRYIYNQNCTNLLEDDSVLTVIGRWAWGPCLSLDADSSYAYIANGTTFQVLDISNPSAIQIIGEYVTGYIYQLRVRGNTAFVCIGSGLLILDITEPTTPAQLSFIEISGLATNFALSDSFAYVGTIVGFLREIDISDLRNPYLRGSIFKFGEISSSIEAKDRFVYIGSPEYPLTQIVDATNPDSLVNHSFDCGGILTSAYIEDTLLYVAVLHASNYFKIFNISNPTQPQFIGQAVLSDSVITDAVTVSQDGLTAYALSTGSGYPTLTEEGIYSIDVSDLTQPVVKDKYLRETQIGANGIALSKNTLIGAYYSGVTVLDVTDPDTLIYKSFFGTGGSSQKINLEYPYAFLASGLSGVWVIDVSDPGKPQSVSNIQTGSFISDLVVQDSLIYAVDWAAYSAYVGEDTSSGLWIIDIKDIYDPVILSHYIGITHETQQSVPNSISKSGDKIFITQAPFVNDNNILEIIDVSNPYLPARAGVFQNSTIPYDIANNDTIAYLATDNGLKILDVSNPGNPVEISSILDIARGVIYKYPF